jgi:hypothetical protein
MPELHSLVVDKLTRVFGASRASELLAQVLKELELDIVGSPDDLRRVGEALQRRGGFEAAAGAMFVVQATMRTLGAQKR